MGARKIRINLDRQTHPRVGPGIAQLYNITREQAGREQSVSCERNPIEER